MQQAFYDGLRMTPEMQVREVKNGPALHTDRIILLLGRKSRAALGSEANLLDALRDRGIAVLNPPGESSGQENPEALAKAFKDQAKAIVVAGGDGSINEVLPAALKTGLPICVVPLGTANNLARTLGLPADPVAALSLLWNGSPQPVDVAFANDRPFLNVAGLGLSTRVNTSTPRHWKKWLGPFAFALTAFRLARSMVPLRVRITCDGRSYEGRSLQISVVNGRYFGTGLCLSEEDNLADGTLGCVSIEVDRWWQALHLAPALLRGKVKPSQSVLLLKGREIEVTTRRPVRVDLDGDIRASTPLKIRVLPGAVRIFAPVAEARAPATA